VVPHLGSASQTYSTCAGVGGGRLDRRQRHALPRDAVNREGAPAARDHQSTFLRELFLISLQRPKDLLKLHHRLIHGRADEDIDVSRWTLYSPPAAYDNGGDPQKIARPRRRPMSCTGA